MDDLGHDLEKAQTRGSHHIPQDIDSPIEHPEVSTVRDGEDTETDSPITDVDSIRSHPSTEHAAENIERKETLKRTKSTRSSVRSHAVTIVPTAQRRGLFSRFCFVKEVERPYEYKNKIKWFITMVIALAGAAAPVGSAILLPALPSLSLDLHSTTTITNLSVAMYMLSMSIFPLWWSSFSETLGRRTIYITSFALFTIFNIISALSTNITMLIIMRVLGGGAAASVQAVGAGTIADIWEVRERGKAMGIFYLGPLLGPLLAPIIGGVLSSKWGWRATQWFQVIYGGVVLVVLILFLPETLARKHPIVSIQHQQPETISSNMDTEKGFEHIRPDLTRISTHQSLTLKTKNAAAIFKRCFIDPLSVLLYLRFPAVIITVYLASITFGSLFILNISVQQTFSRPPYDFSVSVLGLAYIPNSIGYIFASILGGRWVDHIMLRSALRAGRIDPVTSKPIFLPEDRMRENAWGAAIIYPAALVWYGWTVEKGVLWIAPFMANFFFGLGSMIIFGLSTTMLTEFMPRRSSSGVAVNNFVRNIFSCVGGIVAAPLISVAGNGYLFTVLGVICWISGFSVIWAMRRFGPRWRVVMDRKLEAGA